MTQTDITNRIIEDFDPVVPCEWLPDREIRLNEYNHMMKSRLSLQSERLIDKYMKEYMNAEPVRTKKFSD